MAVDIDSNSESICRKSNRRKNNTGLARITGHQMYNFGTTRLRTPIVLCAYVLVQYGSASDYYWSANVSSINGVIPVRGMAAVLVGNEEGIHRRHRGRRYDRGRRRRNKRPAINLDRETLRVRVIRAPGSIAGVFDLRS